MRHRFGGPLARWLAPTIAIVGAYYGMWITAAICTAVTLYAWKVHLR